MYSYIYADGRTGINYAVGSKTKEGIERIALDYIQNMMRSEIGYTPPPSLLGIPFGIETPAVPVQPKEIQNVLDAIHAKDVSKSIETWNHYATMFMKQTIACHKIEPLKIVE